MKDEFDKLIDSAKNLELGSAEKEDIKNVLLSHIEKTPVRIGAEMRLNNIKSARSLSILELLSLRSIFIKNMAIALIVVLLVSGGASFAAEGALPGDVLYPVKVGINEEVVAALTINSEAKANWNARVAERRLEEAETLAARGALDADASAKIAANFDEHAERVHERIARFETEKNLKAASNVSSNFETSLRAHENILNRIAESKTEVEIEVRPIIDKVRIKIDESEKNRTRLEVSVEARTNGEFKAAAEGKINAAENKIAETKHFIQQNKDSVEAETATKAEAELKLAESAVAEGRAKMEAEAYGEAFVLSQKAIRITQNAKLIMQAEKQFEIEIGIPPLHLRGESQVKARADFGGQESGSVREDETKSESEIDVESSMETETNVGPRGDSSNVKSESKVKIDLGL